MEDVYTIKVRTKPDTRNLYPSERRYSASTVSGIAWVHIALAATSFLLACLALVNSNPDVKRLTINDTEQKTVNRSELVFNLTGYNDDFNNVSAMDGIDADLKEDMANFTIETAENNVKSDSNYILVLAPMILTVFALAAGISSIMASTRWYIDRNITWLFIMSVLSTLIAFISLIMVVAWFIATESDITVFYKDTDPFKDYFVVKHGDVIERNESHMIVKASERNDTDTPNMFAKRVLSINIMIACFLELLWSILSVKISYKGMRNNKEEEERRGNCISVVTTIKGNNTKRLPRNGKLLPPKPDLTDHYPSQKIKRIFLAQNDNGFYLKNQNNKAKNTESSSEFQKERMMNFLNRCASLEGVSNPERTPSVQSETLNPIPEVTSVEINLESNPDPVTPEIKDRMTPVSWGDTPEHTVYNQNNLNLENLFKFGGKKEEKTEDAE